MNDFEETSPGLYRSRNNLIFGVCAGVAEHLNLSVFWTRTLALIALVVTGFWPVGALYLVAALLMKKDTARIWRDGSRGENCSHRPRREGTLDERMRGVRTGATNAMDWDERLRRGI